MRDVRFGLNLRLILNNTFVGVVIECWVHNVFSHNILLVASNLIDLFFADPQFR